MGVMALIVVIAVMSGFESDITKRILGVEAHILLEKKDGKFKDYKPVTAMLESMDQIKSVTPFIRTHAMIRSSFGASGVVIKGIAPESGDSPGGKLNLKPLARKKGPDGKSSLPGIILGRDLAFNLGVFKGDTVYIISPRGMIAPYGYVPSMKKFVVKGSFNTGMYEYDSTLVYMNIDEARHILRSGKKISGIEIRLTDIYEAQKLAGIIRKKLGPGFVVKDWGMMNKNFFSALRLEKTAMFVILSLIVLVAAFNIAGSLVMMVMEKTKDIAILKAMGAKDKSIKKIFVFKGMCIGAAGTLAGVFFGSVLCFLLKHYEFVRLPQDIYYITTLPVKLNITDIMIIAVCALLISFIATLYPARQASGLDPAKAFRYG